jgi:hypothetical protein
MAALTISAPSARTISTVGTTTASYGSLAITGATAGMYYRIYLYITGNSTPVFSNNYGLAGGASWSITGGYSGLTDTALLTALASASAFTWYAKIREYATEFHYNAGSPINRESNSATAALTIGTAAAVRNDTAIFPYISSTSKLNIDTTTSFKFRWQEPSSHSGWRTKIRFYIETLLEPIRIY